MFWMPRALELLVCRGHDELLVGDNLPDLGDPHGVELDTKYGVNQSIFGVDSRYVPNRLHAVFSLSTAGP